MYVSPYSMKEKEKSTKVNGEHFCNGNMMH